MATVQELVTICERMGLQDDSLREFVQEQQGREDWQKEREKKEREKQYREQ